MPQTRTAALRACLAVALVLLVTTWPLALHPVDRLLGLAEVEAVEHMWTLWLGARAGPLVIHTDLASYPFGYDWVLADPLNLAFYLPGSLVSASLGFHLVHLGNLALCGLAAVLAGRWLLPGDAPPAWITAALAVGAVPLAGNLLTGMTEAQTLWLSLLGPVLLLRGLETGGRGLALAAAVCGLSAWGGPYTALYAALVALLLLPARLPALLRAVGPGPLLARLALVGLGAALLAAPVLWAVTTQRPEGLPGTRSMTDLVLSDPALPHNRYLGADPLAVLLPRSPPGSTLVHATYLGLGVQLLALVGLLRRRAWLLGTAVAGTTVLGLGLYLQLGDTVPEVGGRILSLPAGWLSFALEPLGRAARWHRMLTVAAMLLAPLAAAGIVALTRRLPATPRAALAVLLVAACVGDQVLLSPLQWPRATQDARLPAIYAAMPEAGPIMVVPKQPRRIAELPRSPARALLWQTRHGMPIAERPMYQKTHPDLHALRDGLRVGAKLGDTYKATQAREELRRLGYRWIVHHDEPGNTISAEQLVAVLGEPDLRTDDALAWQP